MKFEIGQILPRAEDAWSTDEKWTEWILRPDRHGTHWWRVFGHVDRDEIWAALIAALEVTPIGDIRFGGPGINCGVHPDLTFNGRTARVRTSWPTRRRMQLRVW